VIAPEVETWQERYASAQAMLLAAGGVANGAVHPHWLDDDRFWYRRRGPEGLEYRIVQAATGEARTAFTHAAVTEALSRHLGDAIDEEQLVPRELTVDPVTGRASFRAAGEAYVYDPARGTITPGETADPGLLVSPDGRHGAFVRDGNVWLRELESGEERALTTDGSDAYAYAAKPSVWRYLDEFTSAPPPEALWSPDSLRLLTLQVDERHVPELPQIDYAPLQGVRPRLAMTRTSLPGDERVGEFRIVSIDVATGAQTEPRHGRVSAVRMNDTPFSGNRAWWSADGRTAYFVDIERGERAAHVVTFDVTSGAARVVFSETSDSYVELGPIVYEPALLQPLPATNELIWYSERSGDGHLYLYDLETGELKRALTAGPWRVQAILHVDPERREVMLAAAGIARDEDPYIRKPCLVSLDGGPTEVLSDEAGDHIVWRPADWTLLLLDLTGDDPRGVSGVSPGAAHFVETVGTVVGLPRTVLRRRDGELVGTLEIADDSGLPEGWRWPEPVELTAADGVTPVHGLLFEPRGFDPSGLYPLIDLIYGGPQLSFVPKSAFAQGGLGTDLQLLEGAHLASLGAYVLLLDGRGTAGRERSFREASYGATQNASNVEDHVAGIRQLAERAPSIDLERVGVCGFSAGGFGAAHAALRFGDFFRVAVAGGGNYDERLFWHTWGERYHGLFDPDLYAAQAVRTYASGLTGKLLLIHGLADPVCHPGGLHQLLQALIDENKDVDLVLEPREGHQLGGYGLRRRLDYFVTHLFASTPPVGVRFATQVDALAASGATHPAQET
jgi:dipeptidyl-peptidase-4